MKRNRNKGFTLIELLIVIAIIAILATIAIPNMLQARKRAYDTKAQTCASEIAKAEEMYILDNDQYANDFNTLQTAFPGVVKDCDTNTMSITANTVTDTRTEYSYTVYHNSGSKSYTVTAANGITSTNR